VVPILQVRPPFDPKGVFMNMKHDLHASLYFSLQPTISIIYSILASVLLLQYHATKPSKLKYRAVMFQITLLYTSYVSTINVLPFFFPPSYKYAYLLNAETKKHSRVKILTFFFFQLIIVTIKTKCTKNVLY
jgi:hypothetical protein